ncbi:MAG: acyl-CoA dehydratase activase [Candidatus Methanofastidiosia archaeon]
MISAGIDCGAKFTKVVILKDMRVIAKSMILSGFDQEKSAKYALNEALERASLQFEKIESFIATGVGRKALPFVQKEITEVSADSKGATFLFPSTKTIIDVGAEEGRAIKCDENSKVLDFAINEKCAAGAGAFTEAMARALELELEEFGRISLQSEREIPMNAQCTIFAESEVVSLIHAKTPKCDIAKAVHDAIASRISSMVRRVGILEEVTLIGGLARNPGFVASLKEDLGVDFLIPKEPEFVGALGAALLKK